MLEGIGDLGDEESVARGFGAIKEAVGILLLRFFAKNDHNFSLHVQSVVIIVFQFRCCNAVASEDQRSLDLCRTADG